MSSDLMRRYIDILNENAQPQQLDEGVMDMIKSAAQKLAQKLPPDQAQKIADFVSKTLGKPIDQISMADVNKENAQKLVAADKNYAMSEGFFSDKESNQWGKGGGILGAIAGVHLGAMMMSMGATTTDVPIIAAMVALLFAVIFKGISYNPALARAKEAERQKQAELKK